MKKNLTLFVVMIMVVLLTGCSGGNNQALNKNINVSFEDLTFELPSEFKKMEENGDNDILFYEYQSEDNKNLCMLSISKSDYISSDLNETIKMGFFGTENIEIVVKNINNNDWTLGTMMDGEKQSIYHYAINYNNKLYELSYDDFGSGDLCAKYLNMIEENLNFKN